MRWPYALATLSLLLAAACGTDNTGPENSVAPLFSEPRGYNEVSSGSGWVRADKDDYAPGETVTIGRRLGPCATVVMTLMEEPDVQVTRPDVGRRRRVGIANSYSASPNHPRVASRAAEAKPLP